VIFASIHGEVKQGLKPNFDFKAFAARLRAYP
jgi:hypothetical protein